MINVRHGFHCIEERYLIHRRLTVDRQLHLWKNKQQESIPVGCVLPACQPYVFRWPPLGVSNVMGVVGNQMDKFEQVSGDDHQMSGTGEGG